MSDGVPESAWLNMRRLLSEAGQFQGDAETLAHDHDHDRVHQEVRFYGFTFRNRGNVLHASMQAAQLDIGPEEQAGEPVVFIDGEEMLWQEAVTRVRSLPTAPPSQP